MKCKRKKAISPLPFHTIISQEHDCKLTQEIVELVDREADLLMRGVKESNLDGLRKRISTLFLQYCKTPVFNPEIARLLKVRWSNVNGVVELSTVLSVARSTKSTTPNVQLQPLAHNSIIHLQVPQDSTALRANIYFCSSCNKYLPSTDFQLSSKSDTVSALDNSVETAEKTNLTRIGLLKNNPERGSTILHKETPLTKDSQQNRTLR